MPIDPSIPLQSFAVKPFDPYENRMRLEQLRAIGDTRALRQLHMQQDQMKMDELTRSRNQKEQIRQAAISSVVTPQQSYNTGSLNVGGMTLPGHQTTVQGPEQFDQNTFASKLNSIDPLAGMDYQSKMAEEQAARQKQQLDLQKGIADILKTQGETGKLQLEQLRQRLQMSGQLGNAILRAPQNIRPRIAAQVAQFAVDNGLTPPEQLPQGMLQGQYTPETEAWVNSIVTQSMDVDKVIDNELKVAQFGYQQQNDARQLAMQKRGQDITMRGQNMTDARARETNQIARENKQNIQDLQTQDALQSFDETIAAADELKNHPGLSTSVGVKGVTGALPTWMTPGTHATDFKAKLETFQSKLFLPMVSKLKGMGQLSDAEGRKLTAAAGALNRDMSEAEFKGEVDKIIASLTAARARKAGSMSPQTTTGPKVGDIKKFPNGKTGVWDGTGWVAQ